MWNIILKIIVGILFSLICSIGINYIYNDLLENYIINKNDKKFIKKERLAFYLSAIVVFILLFIFNIL